MKMNYSVYGQPTGHPVSIAARHEADVHLMKMKSRRQDQVGRWAYSMMETPHTIKNCAPVIGAARTARMPSGLAIFYARPRSTKTTIKATKSRCAGRSRVEVRQI